MGRNYAATWLSNCFVSIPSLNFIPSITFQSCLNPRNLRQLCCAHRPSLNIMHSIPFRLKHPFERRVRLHHQLHPVRTIVKSAAGWRIHSTRAVAKPLRSSASGGAGARSGCFTGAVNPGATCVPCRFRGPTSAKRTGS